MTKLLPRMVSGIAAFALLFGQPAFAQADAYSAEDRVVKEDGRFIARVSNRNVRSFSNGFIDTIYLRLEWWGLLGQPVEQYGIRWEMGSRVDIPDGKGGVLPLEVAALDKYPDLKNRWMNLKPVDLTLSVNITLYEPGHIDDSGDYPLEAPHYFNYSDFATAIKHVRRSPHLMIAKAGKAGEDFLPSSPQSWSQFVEWTGTGGLDGGDPNAAARNTFRRTHRIVFGSPQIETIELPEASMRAIYEEFQRRERAEQEQESAEERLAEKTRQLEDERKRREAEDKLAQKMADIASGKTAEEKLSQKLAEMERYQAKERLDRQIEEEIRIAENSGNEYLGAEEARGTYVTVWYRDHGKIDGDRVRLFSNRRVIERSITLRGSGNTTRVSLVPGVNRITFLALNEGTASPNTAEFEVRDSDGTVLMHREWNIEEGYEATLLILRR